MKLTDAMMSGKPFKRPTMKRYLICTDNYCHYPKTDPLLDRFDFTNKDILAEDWELEEKKITLTESQFKKMFWEDALKLSRNSFTATEVLEQKFNQLIKRLF